MTRIEVEEPMEKDSYTRGVTFRTYLARTSGLCALGLLLCATPASAQTARDTARAAAQAAHAVGDAADKMADDDVAAPEKAPTDPIERARQGIVVLERRGKVIGVGSVLNRDGRILTALSPLGHGNGIDARFADGSVSQVRVGHSDRGWDLALLIPQNARWKKGLRASRVPATQAGTQLRAFSVVRGKKVAASRTIIKGENTLVGADSELLRDALEVSSRLKPTDIGSPIVDAKGRVVAIIARACAPGKEVCSPIPFGVPTSAVKAFLRTVPANAVPPAPWLGLQGVGDQGGPVHGVRVLGVHPKSPAAAAGLRGNRDRGKADKVVAVDGVPVTSAEALASAVNRRAVGDSVNLLLFGDGKYRNVTVTLRAAPDTRQKPRKHRGKR